MREANPINDNRKRDWISANKASDPDRHYVQDYLTQAVQHFKDSGIHLETINDALTDEIVKLRPGDPFSTPADENALWSNLYLLWDVRSRIAPLIAQYERRLERLERRRREEKPASHLPAGIVVKAPFAFLAGRALALYRRFAVFRRP